MEKAVELPFGRHQLAKLFIGVGAEVGVERAVFSKTICQQNPGVTLYCIDPWRAYKGYREHVSQEKLNGFLLEATERMAPYNARFIRQFSLEAVKQFENESLNFVYIDANHSYENTLADITAWAEKVKKGGIVAGHDYVKRKGQADIYGVVPAVQEYVKSHGISNWQIWRGDKSPSWAFVK